MSGKQTAESREGLFWPTLGLIIFLLVWLGLCTAGFWYLYVQVTAGFSDPQSALTALQWMTWPFVVLAIAGPVVVILSIGGLRMIRDLLEMQKLIINLPNQPDSMQTVLSEFRTLGAQMLTDVSRVRGDEGTSSEEAVAAAPVQDGGNADRRAEHLDEFFELYNEAKEIFYPALEEYNARGGEPLIVTSGGANFPTDAEQLRDKREFDTKSNENNRKIAEFVITAFELERASRRYRSYLTREMVQELRTLRSRIKNRPRIQQSAYATVQPNA